MVDSSVWIDFFRGGESAEVDFLTRQFRESRILVGDLVLLEVLQGVRNDREAREVETALRAFEVRAMLDPELAVAAAANYRKLRGVGVTNRKTIDLIIGTFCIHHTLPLLASDRDFRPLAEHLGLELVKATN
jgi:predicted nucleic acid-binding protein